MEYTQSPFLDHKQNICGLEHWTTETCRMHLVPHWEWRAVKCKFERLSSHASPRRSALSM